MQVFLQDDSPANAVAFANVLEAAIKQHPKSELKAFILVKPGDPAQVSLIKANVPSVGVAVLEGGAEEGLKLYKISSDPKVKNTVFVYKDRKVVDKFVNLDATGSGARSLNEAIDKVVK